MTKQKIVGVVFSRADLHRALRMRRPPDLFEIRLDRLVDWLDELPSAIRRLPRRIITARDPREGGAHDLSAGRRRALLLEYLPGARYVDVELRSAQTLQPVLQLASTQKIAAIISFHDFKSTPSAARLDHIAAQARSLGATIVKVATRTDNAPQLDALLDFFQRQRRYSDVVAMGIGKLGRTSRLELARLGCVLNYAHLGTPAAEGQLSVAQLRRFTERVDPVS
ncbi:MAG: 3-dehydroquinate dehydratase [Verrucomicrobiota bacterium]|jgi:3-dehydroquinate dehydratase-1